MGWMRIYPAKNAMGDPLPLPEWAQRMNAEAERQDADRLMFEEYPGEAESRGLTERGFNKP